MEGKGQAAEVNHALLLLPLVWNSGLVCGVKDPGTTAACFVSLALAFSGPSAYRQPTFLPWEPKRSLEAWGKQNRVVISLLIAKQTNPSARRFRYDDIQWHCFESKL